jgi:hypothetical protein
MHKKKKSARAEGKGEQGAYLMAVSSDVNPESSSSEGCLLAFREPWREVCLELARDPLRDASREAALRETVLPLSNIWRRRSGILERGQKLGGWKRFSSRGVDVKSK